MARFAVVGAGIAGLSAAWELERTGAEVVVLEAADRIGGKLQQSAVPPLGFAVEEGADAFLARVPDALDLCAELGIDDLVHPAVGHAWVHTGASGGTGLHRLPRGQLLGIPTDLDELAVSGLVSADAVARCRAELDADHPPLDTDVSVGALVRSRLGDEVCDHVVEPLLGGINGGEADGLSAEAAAAQIWACARPGGSLLRNAIELRGRSVDPSAPVFATPAAGMATLPRALVARLRAEVRTGVTVPPLAPATAGGVDVGGERFDGVVLAVPADVAGRLVASVEPDAAATLGATEFASVAMVTAVCDAGAVDHPLDGSGLVVARTSGASITAASWASTKWAHWDDGEHVVFRISLGHDGDPTDWCARTDDELSAVAIDDLARIMDVDLAPVGVRVGRWARSFPQYRPGHLGRTAGIRDALRAAGPIEVAGMSYDGIGVPACIRGGRTAARALTGANRR